MESIAPKERFYPCPICRFSISSNLPKCARCGLEVGGDGIDELAGTEEAKNVATKDAKFLSGMAFWFALISTGTNYVLTADSIFVVILLELWFFVLASFLWKLWRWHQNHSLINFELDSFEEAKKEKKKALIIFLSALTFVVGTIFYRFFWH